MSIELDKPNPQDIDSQAPTGKVENATVGSAEEEAMKEPPRMLPDPMDRGLVCPGCRGRKFDVVYTRARPGGRIERRRACCHCGRRITTWEKAIGAG
jgi:hypothetical protein